MAMGSWHNIVLQSEQVKLRPFVEDDWQLLFKWCNDPEVLYYSDGNDIDGYDFETVKRIYKPESKEKFLFLMDVDNITVGECWLQRMNLNRILEKYPHSDCRRIDLTIGEKNYWGQGIGTETIRLLTDFGFTSQNADMIFGCDIGDHNQRSLRAFKRAGFREHAKLPGDKSEFNYDLVLSREEYFRITTGST